MNIALVGRPNVGKSTLFNRLARGIRSITHDEAFATRDVLVRPCRNIPGVHIMDAPGILDTAPADLNMDAMALAKRKIRQAKLVLFVLDAREGYTPWDTELLVFIRKLDIPFWIVANKWDVKGPHHEDEFTHLGRCFFISAEHNDGIEELEDALREHLDIAKPEPLPERGQKRGGHDYDRRIAIVGAPNVGKSSLLNALANEEKSLVSPIPGTTRDPVSAVINQFELWDTAGLRLSAGRSGDLDFYSKTRMEEIIAQSTQIWIVLDYERGASMVDCKLAERALDLGKGALIIVNKWDLAGDRNTDKARDVFSKIKERMPFMEHVPILFVSAERRYGLKKIMEHSDRIKQKSGERVATSFLNRCLKNEKLRRAPGDPLQKVLSISHVAENPPRFYCAVKIKKIDFKLTRTLKNFIYSIWKDTMGVPVIIEQGVRKPQEAVKRRKTDDKKKVSAKTKQLFPRKQK